MNIEELSKATIARQLMRISITQGVVENNKQCPKQKPKLRNTKAIFFESQLIKKPNEIAEACSIHFTTTGPKLAEKRETKEFDCPKKYLALGETSTTSYFKFQLIYPKTIEAEIRKAKYYKAADYDNVSLKLLQDTAGILSKPLAAIYNSPFEVGTFPDISTIARVTSIFNSGQKNIMNSYRSISVLSIISRVLESLDRIKSQTT